MPVTEYYNQQLESQAAGSARTHLNRHCVVQTAGCRLRFFQLAHTCDATGGGTIRQQVTSVDCPKTY
jgi:hypothetical protein